MIRSEFLLLHEVTNGPFDRSLPEYAPLARREDDPESINDYVRRLALKLAADRV